MILKEEITLGQVDTEKLPNGPKLPHTQISQPEHGSLWRALIENMRVVKKGGALEKRVILVII